ncbi:MAG: rhodanese-like domain-containing protein [Prolixibacteraceae bacterium]
MKKKTAQRIFCFKLILVVLITCVLTTSCSEEESQSSTNSYTILAEQLELAAMDVHEVLNGPGNQNFLMKAPDNGDVSDKWVMDIRNASDYVKGHIPGAKHAGYKDILTEAAAAHKPVLIVDYTGEVASYAAILLRLYGYHDAQALKWGMSGWSEEFDVWSFNTQDLTNASNWSHELKESGTFHLPQLSTTSSGGDAIVKERVEKVFAAGYKPVRPGEVLENPSDYFINSYMPLNDYLGFGHIQGAVQIYPLNLANMNRIDSQRDVVIYSHSGHISAAVTAYLNVLGFNAYNLKYGLNGMTTSNPYWLETNFSDHWGSNARPKNLPVYTETE